MSRSDQTGLKSVDFALDDANAKSALFHFYPMYRPLSLVFVSVLIALASNAQSVVIYADNFSGSSSNDLNGSAPDTRPGSETWVGAVGAVSWNADGSVTGTGNTNAFLPFAPQSGYIYTLSASLNPNEAGNSDGLSLGFNGSAGVSSTYANQTGAVAWINLRQNRGLSDSIETFLGPNVSGGGTFLSQAGVLNVSLVLNTTDTLWTARWLLGDTVLRSANFTVNPTINYVGIGRYASATGAISNFTLTSVPEPSAAAILMGAMVGAFALLRRNRFVARQA